MKVAPSAAAAAAAQVMEEGERLSKKQLAQESTIKKLRAGLKEAGEARAAQDAALASERTRLQDALAARTAAEDARQVRNSFPMLYSQCK